MKKTTKKTIKPEYIVDITNCADEEDILTAMITAKLEHGKAITKSQFDYMMTKVMENFVDFILEAIFMRGNAVIRTENGYVFGMAMPAVDEEPEQIETVGINAAVKKPNIFKRFWNWITGK